jgi:hypothetical protein
MMPAYVLTAPEKAHYEEMASSLPDDSLSCTWNDHCSPFFRGRANQGQHRE